MLLHQPMAWTQCTVPVLIQTRSPGRWINRYTGTLASYISSRFGHHEPIRKLTLFFSQNSLITPQYGSGTANHSQSPGPMLMLTEQKLLFSWWPEDVLMFNYYFIKPNREAFIFLYMKTSDVMNRKGHNGKRHLRWGRYKWTFMCTNNCLVTNQVFYYQGPSWRVEQCSCLGWCSPHGWASSLQTPPEQMQAAYSAPVAEASTCRGSKIVSTSVLPWILCILQVSEGFTV